MFLHRMLLSFLVLEVLLILETPASSLLARSNILQLAPPAVKYGVNYDAFDGLSDFTIADDNDDESFIWEKSGLFEGDIMLYRPRAKNGLIDTALRWSNATIPFYIQEEHFSDEEIEVILSAIKDFHLKTCLRFKPYQESDVNWIFITGNEAGCWSSVGMKGKGGQQLNVHSPKCVKKGVLMHEMLHAAGFFHQQSASNRDDHVKIMWENISDGHKSNFRKYDKSVVTDFGTSYDYESIMHYSGKAFSKNGELTIVPLNSTITTLGQRDGFTEKDLIKLNQMYNSSCHQSEDPEISFANVIDWFRTLFT